MCCVLTKLFAGQKYFKNKLDMNKINLPSIEKVLLEYHLVKINCKKSLNYCGVFSKSGSLSGNSIC